MSSVFDKIKNKKVLVTGGYGFIGSNVAKRCCELGAKVTVLDSLDSHCAGNKYNAHDFEKDAEFIIADLRNYDYLEAVMQDKEILFNCAAYTSHAESMTNPILNLDVNCRAVINIFEAAKNKNRDIKIVHVGTTTQLGRLQYQPADEKHPEFPTDIYSAHKTLSEKYTLIYSLAYGINTTVLRLPNTYGPRARINSPQFTFNNFFIGLALGGKDITVYGDGKQLRNVLYVEEAAEALIEAALVDSTNGQTFFATSDEHYSVAEIAKKTVEVLGVGSSKAIFIDWPEGKKAVEIGDNTFSNEKIKKTLSWRPKTLIKEGLERTKAYYSNCLGKYL